MGDEKPYSHTRQSLSLILRIARSKSGRLYDRSTVPNWKNGFRLHADLHNPQIQTWAEGRIHNPKWLYR